jgi:uncharacterized protein (TIGR02453 family)
MPSSVDLKPTLAFLDQLAKNNNKPWFETHRAQYEQARTGFEEFVQLLIAEISKFDDLGMLSARECIFRINRDLRFSKDKSPYKTNMGASIAPGGKKGVRLSYYLHLMPHDQSFLGGGMHMPMPDQLSKFRQAIDRDAAPFKKIIRAKSFVQQFGMLGGDKLATAPKGYAKDHPEIELLKLKEVVAGRQLRDKEILSPGIVVDTARTFQALKPFLRYLDSVLL